MIQLTSRERLTFNNQAYQPSGFIVDYRDNWDRWDAFLEKMRPTAHDTIRFNLGVSPRGGLCLHHAVPPGQVNTGAVANLITLKAKLHGFKYVINWLHRGGAGDTVPMDWIEFPDEVAARWPFSSWNADNEGPASHPRDAFDLSCDPYWFASLRALYEIFGDDPAWVGFVPCTEGYYFSAWVEDARRFQSWQARMCNYLRDLGYRGLFATGDGSINKGAHKLEMADVCICHNHTKGEAKPRIITQYETGSKDGFFNHIMHPMMDHIDRPYWCMAMGYGQMLRASTSVDDFGYIRTLWDAHANIEYAFSGHIGLGMNWDHEGFLAQYDAPGMYDEFVRWFRANSVENGVEILFAPGYEKNETHVALTLTSSLKMLVYVYERAALPFRGGGLFQVQSPWGIRELGTGWHCITPPLPTPPPIPAPKPKKKWWEFLFDWF